MKQKLNFGNANIYLISVQSIAVLEESIAFQLTDIPKIHETSKETSSHVSKQHSYFYCFGWITTK